MQWLIKQSKTLFKFQKCQKKGIWKMKILIHLRLKKVSWVALLATTGIKFLDPVEDSDTSGPSSLIVKMEYIFAFQC